MADLVDLYAAELERRGSKRELASVTNKSLWTVAADCGPLDRADLRAGRRMGRDSRRTHDGAPIGASTRWNYVSGLNRFYAWAKESGHLSTNPVAGMLKPPIESVESRTITYDDLQRAINMAMPPSCVASILAAYQGLRPQDVAMLEWSDVDLVRRSPSTQSGWRRISADQISNSTHAPWMLSKTFLAREWARHFHADLGRSGDKNQSISRWTRT